MTPEQDRMAREFIDSLNRDVVPREPRGHSGYNWYIPGVRKRMGFVRYNVDKDNAGYYTFYPASNEFNDPRRLFVNEHASQVQAGWKVIVHPDNQEDMRYVRRIMRETIDRNS